MKYHLLKRQWKLAFQRLVRLKYLNLRWTTFSFNRTKVNLTYHLTV
jgi:hypothetical protein